MFETWSDFDRTVAWMDDVRRHFEQLFDEASPHGSTIASGRWPRLAVSDNGEEIRVRALVPGLEPSGLNVTVDNGVLSLSGEIKPVVPEGYTMRRQERRGYKFSRQITLPYEIDTEKSVANSTDGVVTISLPKSEAAKPRQIVVRGS